MSNALQTGSWKFQLACKVCPILFFFCPGLAVKEIGFNFSHNRLLQTGRGRSCLCTADLKTRAPRLKLAQSPLYYGLWAQWPEIPGPLSLRVGVIYMLGVLR